MPDPAVGQPPTNINDTITGGVDDLIGLTHLHEPAILHALRLRYDADIIYTSTGPILLAINPFKVRYLVVVVELREREVELRGEKILGWMAVLIFCLYENIVHMICSIFQGGGRFDGGNSFD